MTTPKKLIEVALPLEAINTASAREKSIRHGHPSTLHLWWARRPLASARAVIFAQMVDDPSAHPDLFPTEKAQEKERQRLFQIIEDLVLWENTTNEEVIQRARDAIWESWRRTCAANADHPRATELFDRYKLPAFHDPFAGGGALPLEAQRLGLESHASDLNPVAVLINKAMIEIPPKFSGKAPVNPDARKSKDLIARTWKGAEGLADDVRHYGQWMRDEAAKRIGNLYPPVEVTADMVAERPDLKPYLGKKLTVIAWLWARTVKSPNPAFRNVEVPLASTFMLSTKAGKEAYVEPVIEDGGYRFTVKVGKPKDAESAKNGTKLSRGANFLCLMSGAPIPSEHIYSEATSGRMGAKLMAIVAEGDRGRVYLSPTRDHEVVASTAQPEWKPELAMPENPRWFSPPLYGLTKYGDLFTPRQLVALTTFSDLVGEARERAKKDALAAGLAEGVGLAESGTGAVAYAEAVGLLLSFAQSKQTDLSNSLCRWEPVAQCPRNLFGRQAIPMIWDFAEGNPLGESSGAWTVCVDGFVRAFAKSFEKVGSGAVGTAQQADASSQTVSLNKVVSTDPPYYDNIGYADLSDFFYVWLRRAQRSVFPSLLSTLAVPKAEELVATPYRHGGRDEAEKFFLEGMTRAMHRLAQQSHPAVPVSIYYAFKQSETEGSLGTSSTGWETFLGAVIEAGFVITGTWPIRTENGSRMIGQGTNALASSIVLVCRQRSSNALAISRREFQAALKAELPPALIQLQKGNIAPVDLAQAAIGPGMAVYSRYSQITDASGKAVSVREALALINQVLDETLADQEGDFDAGTRWALAWFEQYGFAEGEYGVAETLSKAKDTSISGLADAGIVTSGKGRVRLVPPGELNPVWNAADHTDASTWEVVHHLVRVFEGGGDVAAASVVKALGSRSETSRELCYRLYTVCERKKRAAEALSYNALVQSWPELQRLALGAAPKSQKQANLFEGDE
jgi:putative DNA methylase